MIDVQAADAPASSPRPSGVSFGLLRPGTAETRSIELSDAGGGAGTWTVSAQGLARAATVDMPQGGAQKLELTLARRRAARSATARATSS